MGTYLNPNNQNFLKFVQTGKYIDKTMLIAETNRRLDDLSGNFVCVSRPRRFGKSIAEDMLAAYYSKGASSRTLFSQFKIAGAPSFEENLNRFNVIKIDLNLLYAQWKSKEIRPANVIFYLNELLLADFRKEFPDVTFKNSDALPQCIQTVYEQNDETFIIIIDEYDVMVREQVSKEDFGIYLAFLNSLFKNAELKPAISLAYLTGILPIIRDKIQSKLNTFRQYTMVDAGDFAEFVGFTAEEVRSLCKKYGRDLTKCRSWYDGYRVGEVEAYNPEAVIQAVTTGAFKSYWGITSTYEVVSEKIRMNFAGTKDDVITMLGGGKVDVNVSGYQNTLTDFASRDDVFTFLIHLGYLAYDERERQCYIPNREIHEEWMLAIRNDEDYAETNRIIKESKALLRETIDGNEEAVAEALDRSHVHVTSNRNYNNEDALQSAIIVELKRNGTAESALNQIREKRYFDCLSAYRGGIILVGVNYDEKSKRHECRIERLMKEA